MIDLENPQGRIIEISSPQKPVGRLNLTLTLLLLLLIFVSLAFATGFFLGRVQSSTKKEQSTGKSSTTTTEGKTTFTSQKEKYSIVFPETWKATEKTSLTPGIVVESGTTSVELWLKVEQPYSLSKEQLEAITATNKVKIKVNSQDFEMTQYSYNTGGFFSVLVIPATVSTPIATFWLKAPDKDSYTTALETVQSFKFT